MEVKGVVHEGVIVLDDPSAIPEGTRVQVIVEASESNRSFGERYSQFKGAVADLPEDLAMQHEHYRHR
jgi:hypothetical protein